MKSFLSNLQRWSSLEPSRCTHQETYSILFLGGLWFTVVHNYDKIDAHGLALIQAAVQDAIAARSWRWVGGSGFSGADHSAHIYGPLPEAPWLANGRSEESFTKALLEAYLQALQADA